MSRNRRKSEGGTDEQKIPLSPFDEEEEEPEEDPPEEPLEEPLDLPDRLPSIKENEPESKFVLDKEFRQLEQYIDRARCSLWREEQEIIYGQEIRAWISMANQAVQEEKNIQGVIDEFTGWIEPLFSLDKEDPRAQVLILLLKEQERLKSNYHLDAAGDRIVLSTDSRYRKDSNKIAMRRANLIADLAKELRQSIREHPAEKDHMPLAEVYNKLKTLRDEMHSTGRFRFFVTGKMNIAKAMEIVAEPKISMMEKIKKRIDRFRLK